MTAEERKARARRASDAAARKRRTERTPHGLPPWASRLVSAFSRPRIQLMEGDAGNAAAGCTLHIERTRQLPSDCWVRAPPACASGVKALIKRRNTCPLLNSTMFTGPATVVFDAVPRYDASPNRSPTGEILVIVKVPVWPDWGPLIKLYVPE